MVITTPPGTRRIFSQVSWRTGSVAAGKAGKTLLLRNIVNQRIRQVSFITWRVTSWRQDARRGGLVLIRLAKTLAVTGLLLLVGPGNSRLEPSTRDRSGPNSVGDGTQRFWLEQYTLRADRYCKSDDVLEHFVNISQDEYRTTSSGVGGKCSSPISPANSQYALIWESLVFLVVGACLACCRIVAAVARNCRDKTGRAGATGRGGGGGAAGRGGREPRPCGRQGHGPGLRLQLVRSTSL